MTGSGWVIVGILVVVALIALSGCTTIQGLFGSTPAQQAQNEATAAHVGGGLAVATLLDFTPVQNQAQVQTVLGNELTALSAALTAGDVNFGAVLAPFDAQLITLVPPAYSNLITIGIGVLTALNVSTASLSPAIVANVQAFIAGAQSGLPATSKAIQRRGADDVSNWNNWLSAHQSK